MKANVQHLNIEICPQVIRDFDMAFKYIINQYTINLYKPINSAFSLYNIMTNNKLK